MCRCCCVSLFLLCFVVVSFYCVVVVCRCSCCMSSLFVVVLVVRRRCLSLFLLYVGVVCHCSCRRAILTASGTFNYIITRNRRFFSTILESRWLRGPPEWRSAYRSEQSYWIITAKTAPRHNASRDNYCHNHPFACSHIYTAATAAPEIETTQFIADSGDAEPQSPLAKKARKS